MIEFLQKTVRVVGPEGELLGVFPRDMAFKKAEEMDLDLVEVAPQADPPVCRIVDFSKYKYEQDKREKEVKNIKSKLSLKK